MPISTIKNVPAQLSIDELRAELSAKYAGRIIHIERNPLTRTATIEWEKQTTRFAKSESRNQEFPPELDYIVTKQPR